MSDYSSSLLRSVIDRAGAFGSYVGSLQSANARSDDGFNAALRMFERYAELLVRQVEFDWRRIKDPASRHDILTGWLRDFIEKEKWFDGRFARGNQEDVPRALLTIARREFRAHGWNNHEPVLTVGAPDKFETHKSDLGDYLFGNLPVVRYADLADLASRPRLSVISVPYIEGTRALWHPIVIGHEVGHIRIDVDRARLQHLDSRAWVSEEDAELAALIEDASKRPAVGVVETIRRSLQNWVDELLCDLNAVRLFGPAGLSAIAEFLSMLTGSDGIGAEAPTGTHPPLSMRIRLMCRFLDEMGHKDTPNYVEPWRDYERTKGMALRPRAQYMAQVLDDHFVDIVAHAGGWGPLYLGHQRAVEVDWVTRELLDGIPAGTHCLAPDALGSPIKVADVVNGAWQARQALDEPADPYGATDIDPSPSTLLDSEAAAPLKRLLVDRLASKAIDSLEFALLWSSTGRRVTNLAEFQSPDGRVGDETSSIPGAGSTGILSRALITRRLKSQGRGRIVVTPLLEDAIQDAGIDLRLSPEFIAFRHSATTAFDALDGSQDPRVMQEAVEKGWGEPFILHPGELVLAATLEYVVLPLDIAAQVVTRSSYGRLGLITATAVQVQPGSRGCITLELVNHGSTPIALTAGSRVAELVFFGIGEPPTEIESGKYFFPVGPEFSKIQDDRDLEALRAVGRTARPEVEPPDAQSDLGESNIAFSFVADADEATLFQAIGESEGAEVRLTPQAELPDVSPLERVSRLAGGETLVTYLVAGAAAISALAATVLRLVRALHRGVVLKISDDDVVVGTPPNLPRGTIVIVSDGANQSRIVLPESSTAAEVAGRLSEAIRARRRDPRSFDLPPEKP